MLSPVRIIPKFSVPIFISHSYDNVMITYFFRRSALFLLFIACFINGCQDNSGQGDDAINPDRSVVYNYFKQIALGSEFGNSSQVIRK